MNLARVIFIVAFGIPIGAMHVQWIREEATGSHDRKTLACLSIVVVFPCSLAPVRRVRE
jgi:hypothetical protein